MIDVHSHIIQNVDDGSKSLDASLEMLKEEEKQGVTKVILTPHYRRRMFETNVKEIVLSFFKLRELTQLSKINIDLYLGQEIYVRNTESLERTLKVLDENNVLTYGNTKYILLEFSYTEKIDISEIVYICKKRGYNPIIAHIERYEYLEYEDIDEIIKAGGFIQVNASSIIGKNGLKTKKFIKNLIKNDMIDCVGSDIHETRVNYMKKAFDYVSKKFGKDTANKIFIESPSHLIEEMNNVKAECERKYIEISKRV